MNTVTDGFYSSITAKRWSRLLGYAGMLPFMPALALPLISDQVLAPFIVDAVVAYSAVILSFVGALHWPAGLYASNSSESAIRLGFSVLPALLGWLALLAQPVIAFAVLIAGFLLVYGFDRRWLHGDRWFLRLRLRLTMGAVLCLSTGLVTALVTV